MWANADDQGRLCGDAEEIKYTCCPNIDHITKSDVKDLISELAANKLIIHYNAGNAEAIQIIDWWDVQRPQWASPSDYRPPDGWADHIRYHRRPDDIFTENWVTPSQRELPETLRSTPYITTYDHPDSLGSKDAPDIPHPLEKERGIRNKETGNIRSVLRSTSVPGRLPDEEKIYADLVENLRTRWGRVKPPDYREIEPRDPTPAEESKFRELAREIAAAGGCEFYAIKEAFDEAGEAKKRQVSYVRAIILDRMGVDRSIKARR